MCKLLNGKAGLTLPIQWQCLLLWIELLNYYSFSRNTRKFMNYFGVGKLVTFRKQKTAENQIKFDN